MSSVIDGWTATRQWPFFWFLDLSRSIVSVLPSRSNSMRTTTSNSPKRMGSASHQVSRVGGLRQQVQCRSGDENAQPKKHQLWRRRWRSGGGQQRKTGLTAVENGVCLPLALRAHQRRQRRQGREGKATTLSQAQPYSQLVCAGIH